MLYRISLFLALESMREHLITTVSDLAKKYHENLMKEVEDELGSNIDCSCQSVLSFAVIKHPILKCILHTTATAECHDCVVIKIAKKISEDHRNLPNWNQTNPSKWMTSSWDIIKCFMPVGYNFFKSVEEIDFSGLLNILIMNKKTFALLNIVDDARSTSITCMRKVQRIRNIIHHRPITFLDESEQTHFFLHFKELMQIFGSKQCSDNLNKMQQIISKINHRPINVMDEDEKRQLFQHFEELMQIFGSEHRSDNLDEESSTSNNLDPLIPPNTPIRHRKRNLQKNKEKDEERQVKKSDANCAAEVAMCISSIEKKLPSNDSLDQLANHARKNCSSSLKNGTVSSNKSLNSVSTLYRQKQDDVNFKKEIASQTPMHQTSVVEKSNEAYECKEKVEEEKVLTLSKTMELSWPEPPNPVVPGLTPTKEWKEEDISIIVQPDESSTSNNLDLLIPPNTPIRHRKRNLQKNKEKDEERQVKKSDANCAAEVAMCISSIEKKLPSNDSLDQLANHAWKNCSSSLKNGTVSSNKSLNSVSTLYRRKQDDVNFKKEIASQTPKHQTSVVEKSNEAYECKEKVEGEKVLALSKTMELSWPEPPNPVEPGLTPTKEWKEEVISIIIQLDDYDKSVDEAGDQPQLYLEGTQWKKGSPIGKGAYSICYQARDVKSGVIMAIKQISFSCNTTSEQQKVVENTTKEINMMTQLNHPNVVRILGATRQGYHFNMFVEWMSGGSVALLLSQYGAFSVPVITSYTLQILRGLSYLHDNHIVHRDVKGENLFVDSTGRTLKIGDFGVAARLASHTTFKGEFQGQFKGTIPFMAPEVVRGEDYGRACDIWSTGCVMIEMATALPPWGTQYATNEVALIYKIGKATEPPPIPNLSPLIGYVMSKCLEMNKKERPKAKELLNYMTQWTKKKYF